MSCEEVKRRGDKKRRGSLPLANHMRRSDRGGKRREEKRRRCSSTVLQKMSVMDHLLVNERNL
ncbi:uncharacterized protein ASCRUDRAFT_75844 [Ascoidea rubescens DSM 1968]|uniref:Uncharacterized protein n=1 Tax=Ascoidea rubescens DSM 1968 TaxID=1344418 RepID=A0A1D2VHP7_9ASCO|nr:hypothetical protein ASCRUDRAFT_75844 [Ascoidea rubescens DSM 1968]ODV61119.1 hypothetical protein ASCRUDRAFT_75844 [Ascoidea rubescens DSM 1968]